NIIVAHRLLESNLGQGGALGELVAEYVFRLAGEDVRVPIRERFEIAIVPTGWGNLPFRALPDQKNYLMPRYEGRWAEAGERQTEVSQGYPRGYYLWAWRNPKPDASVESLTIVPRGPRFIVAAITLGHRDEQPFVREGKREVSIILTDPTDAQKPFDLDVEVDRGVATYVHSLPEATADEFIADTHRGWGEAQNAKSSPAYVEIAAIPSATVTVKQGGTEVGHVTWGEVEEKGVATSPRMRVEFLDRGKNWVHVTVRDDETNKPVPCRVHFRSPEGIPYQPHGHHNQVNSNLGTWHVDIGGDLRLGQITYAYIDGTCQGWLPRGEVLVDVARGFEYEPLRTRMHIEPGQRELTLHLKRWTRMNARRWFSGDTHVHFLSTQGGHRESQGEDLNVVNLLQSQWGSLFTNTEEFTGKPSISADGNNIVYATQENRQHMLGHLTLLGLKNPVMPWCSDGPDEAEMGGTLEVTMSDWADQCHAQGGTVIIPHLPFPNGEPATLIATGRADAVEMLWHRPFNHIEYYRYLNGGYRLPLVGGTDKMTSDVPVGLYRTYVYIPADEEFNYDNWCRNLAHGRTFLSGGPIIHFSVDGHAIGDMVQLSSAGTVEVEAWAESIFPIHTLQVVQQGRVVAATEDAKGVRKLYLKEKVRVEGHTWLAAHCGGPNYTSVPHHDGWGRGIFAHTSPIYVACSDEWHLFDQATVQYMLTLVEGTLTYIRELAPLHARSTVTHHHGQDDHLAYL
ncbi:MAG: CehA/McbA family metallohydrolase, partial [Chloroflexi bacterium]|nr:CehA/McbA family metallohydrolase [Chloroflexota bacterium]